MLIIKESPAFPNLKPERSDLVCSLNGIESGGGEGMFAILIGDKTSSNPSSLLIEVNDNILFSRNDKLDSQSKKLFAKLITS